MELYLSLSAYGGVSTREALTVFWGAGIRHVELAIGPLPDTDAVQAIQDFRQQGMVYRAHHAFVWGSCHYPFNLARSQDWDYFERLTDFLAYGGITAYERAWWEFSNGHKSRQSLCNISRAPSIASTSFAKREALFSVSKRCIPHSLLALFENMKDNASEVAQFCQDAPQIKIVVDLAHLNIWHHHSNSSKLQWLKLPRLRLLEIHIEPQ